MQIDQDTLTLFKHVIKKEGWIELPSSGNSMFPIIKEGNICRFSSCTPGAIKKGDIILFYTLQGQLIAHRFYKTDRTLYYFKGDTNLGFDEPIESRQILGRLEAIYKKSRKVLPETLIPTLWGKIILSFPYISSILQRYLNRRIYFQINGDSK